jgi:glycosyltransferase involved in cell wall biosynthesis
MKPDVTIGLPLYKMKDIQWLALKSIERQECDVTFEVIICTEDECSYDDFTIDNPMCVDVSILKSKQWMPLSLKWIEILEYASGDVFILHGGDDYSDKGRVQRAYNDIIKDGNEWTQDCDGWGYDIGLDRLLRFKQGNGLRGINIALRTNLKNRLPKESINKSVDYWLWKNINPKKQKWNQGVNSSVFTSGMNLISKGRHDFFEKVRYPFDYTEKTINDLLPKDIVSTIKKLDLKK